MKDNLWFRHLHTKNKKQNKTVVDCILLLRPLKFDKKAVNKCCGAIFFFGSNSFFLCFKLWYSIAHNHTATQRKTKSKPLMSWTTVFRQILQLNTESVSSLVYLFVMFSMLPKWKDTLYISLFRVSHYDCGCRTWNISNMYIKRRNCLVLNLLFYNAISTLIMRLVLIGKYRC